MCFYFSLIPSFMWVVSPGASYKIRYYINNSAHTKYKLIYIPASLILKYTYINKVFIGAKFKAVHDFFFLLRRSIEFTKCF